MRVLLKRLDPIFLELYPIHKLWKRDDPLIWPLPELDERHGIERYEYSLFSQNGEDGILRYLFSEIGFSSKLFLEFGFGVIENNSLRLITKEGFAGVLIDGSRPSVKAFNKAAQNAGIANVRAIWQFLDLENLRSTILNSGLPKEIDLLSIDVDGNDYWFWKNITYLDPRVVVIEYNASMGPELSITIPYDANFYRYSKHPSGLYQGASLTALTRLADKKGYVLIGCDSNGVNAFFVRRDCLSQSINRLVPLMPYRLHKQRGKNGGSIEDQFKIIKDMPYIDIKDDI